MTGAEGTPLRGESFSQRGHPSSGVVCIRTHLLSWATHRPFLRDGWLSEGSGAQSESGLPVNTCLKPAVKLPWVTAMKITTCIVPWRAHGNPNR